MEGRSERVPRVPEAVRRAATFLRTYPGVALMAVGIALDVVTVGSSLGVQLVHELSHHVAANPPVADTVHAAVAAPLQAMACSLVPIAVAISRVHAHMAGLMPPHLAAGPIEPNVCSPVAAPRDAFVAPLNIGLVRLGSGLTVIGTSLQWVVQEHKGVPPDNSPTL